jgi:hypothetical protein
MKWRHDTEHIDTEHENVTKLQPYAEHIVFLC